MKKLSIKLAILVPVIAVLVAGIAIMVVIIGSVTQSTTEDLTRQLISATVSRHASEFDTESTYGYAIARALAPVIENIMLNSEEPRVDAAEALRAVLEAENTLMGVWSAWEPNAFDGRDRAFVNYDDLHDDTGRFVPYFFRSGNTIAGAALADYEDRAGSLYYLGAIESMRPFMTDPYLYEIGGRAYTLISIAIPIIRDGRALGAVGVDYNIQGIIDSTNRASILCDGYVFMVSPNGIIATHRETDMIMQNYRTTYLSKYSTELEAILAHGGQFSEIVYSDVTNMEMLLHAQGVMIGETDKYWAVFGVVPMRTVNAASNRLTMIVVGVGLALIVVAGLTILLLVQMSLRKLPVLTDRAERLADGDFRIDNTVIDDFATKNEITLLERSFAHVENVIGLLVGDLKVMGRAIDKDGDTDARIDTSRFSNSYAEVAQSVNSIVKGLVSETGDVMGCLGKFGDGDFDANIAKLPGKKAVMNETIDNLRLNLKTVSDNINSLVLDAIDGKLSSRIDVRNYNGDWAMLMEKLNQLMEAVITPINEASSVLSHVAEGNFDHQMTGSYKGDFSVMKNDINTTVKNMASYIVEISAVLTALADDDLNQDIQREYVGEFSAIKDALLNIIKKFNYVISHISGASSQVASGADLIAASSMSLATGTTEQAASVEELNATVQTINENTQQNAISANEAVSLSTTLKASAEKGNSDMQIMIGSMNEIADSSGKIGKILKVIEDVAFQSNLLALNAAVEAARAGEHGRGFAVVADEVRSLAMKTQASAKETQEMIDENNQRVSEGTEIAAKTAEVLDMIVKEAEDVASIVTGISEASDEQALAISQVNDGMKQITAVVQNNSATAEESASASEELASQSDVLKDMISRFKLKRG